MESKLFRKKSLDSISSPEQLNDYIRVTTPSVWIVLGAIVTLLIGVCIWGIFDSIDTQMKSGAVINSESATLYISEENAKEIMVGNTIKADGKVGKITSISEKPVSYKTVCEKLGQDEYAIYTLGIENQKFLYEVNAKIPDVRDGVFPVEIVTQKIKPMTFVLN